MIQNKEALPIGGVSPKQTVYCGLLMINQPYRGRNVQILLTYCWNKIYSSSTIHPEFDPTKPPLGCKSGHLPSFSQIVKSQFSICSNFGFSSPKVSTFRSSLLIVFQPSEWSSTQIESNSNPGILGIFDIYFYQEER